LTSDLGDELPVTVLRGGKKLDFVVGTVRSEELGLPVMGILPASGRILTEVKPGSAAEQAALKVGDEVESIDGRVFLNWADAVLYMSARLGSPVELTVTRGAERLVRRFAPEPARMGSIGVIPRSFPRIASVFAGSPADRAGILAKDEVLAIDGKPTPDVIDVITLTAYGADGPLRFTLRRAGEIIEGRVVCETRPGQSRKFAGITLEARSDFVVGGVEKGSAADAAGLRPGDVLTGLGKLTLEGRNWDSFQTLLDAAARAGRPVLLAWKSGQVSWKREIKVKTVSNPLLADAGLSVSMTQPRLRKYAPWTAAVVGVKKSWQMVQQVYVFLRGVATRRISPTHAAGPGGIFKLTYKVASEGVTKLIYWLAIIGVNIAVVNILPVPPFDGGLLLLTGVEKIRGRAISDKWLTRLQVAGWAAVMLLLAFVTFNDIKR
jgi:regulator of sigma E protease